MEQKHDVISIIIPVYNMEKHLKRCYESIKTQTYPWLDIIMVDDGSTDDSLALMKKIASEDVRVRVFHQENSGVSAARNLGLDAMKGSYCTFIDPDDYVANIYVEWLYIAVTQTNTKLAICNATGVIDGSPEPEIYLPQKPTVESIPINEYSLWHRASHEVCWGALYSKSLIATIRFDKDLIVSEDTLFFMQALCRCKKLSFIHECPYYYVQYMQSATKGKYTPNRWTEIVGWQRANKISANAPQNLQVSIRAWYAMTCAKIMTLMIHSEYNDPHKVVFLRREIRKNLDAIWKIPSSKKAKKIRLLAFAAFPRIVSFLQWRYYVKKKIVG